MDRSWSSAARSAQLRKRRWRTRVRTARSSKTYWQRCERTVDLKSPPRRMFFSTDPFVGGIRPSCPDFQMRCDEMSREIRVTALAADLLGVQPPTNGGLHE